MAVSSDHDRLQLHTLRAYTVLYALRPDSEADAWAGALILNIGLDPTGSGLSLAGNIVGAACLSLESDPALLRTAQRTGACDFIVTTVDEGLRALKNEIRKRRPLSVGLAGDPATHLAELMDRGLAPELFTAPLLYPEAAARVRSFGGAIVSFEAGSTSTSHTGVIASADLLQAFLASHPYQLHAERVATSAELRAFDGRALALLPREDGLRRHWLITAPRLFPRDRERFVWLTRDDYDQLTSNHHQPA